MGIIKSIFGGKGGKTTATKKVDKPTVPDEGKKVASGEVVEKVVEPKETASPQAKPLDGVKPGLTELVLIIDRSGSMGGLESDTIGGINSVIKQHQQEEGECIISTVLFDTTTTVLHDRLKIKDVEPLTTKDYQVRGCTALLDTVGDSIRHIDRVQRYQPEGYRAEKVIFVITTDGLENASRRHSYKDVKRAIEQKQELGWEFLFLGANIDAAAEAGRLGIAHDRAATYVADHEGNHVMYDAVGAATVGMRRASGARLGGSWKQSIDEDTARRKKG